MSRTDLKALVTEVERNRAAADSYKKSLDTERAAYSAYENSVNRLIDAQEKERAAITDIVKQLNKRLSAPRLELYTGYGSEGGAEGGIRISWSLK